MHFYVYLLLFQNISLHVSCDAIRALHKTKQSTKQMGCIMRKMFCICENRDADQLQRLGFCYIQTVQVQSLVSNPKTSGLLLCLYSSVCVGPSGNPKCLVKSHAKSQMEISREIYVLVQSYNVLMCQLLIFSYPPVV